MDTPYVAIVDYGLGNLFSIKQACKKAGLAAVITSSRQEIRDSSALILTGVGAFGKAMKTLIETGLNHELYDYALSGKPLLGICLGMQLLMTESHEFGRHAGLNIIAGSVLRLKPSAQSGRILKVPFIGWRAISSLQGHNGGNSIKNWEGTLLEDMEEGAQMYFVHSYFVLPREEGIILCKTRYGDNEFCSGIRKGNISAFQFHPECSGLNGIKIYDNLAKEVLQNVGGLK